MQAVFDIAAARDRERARAEARQREVDRLFEEARRDFHAIAAMIAGRYAPQAIVQWGSLLDRDKFTEQSDIDIAIEGPLPAETLFRMLGDAEAMTRFPVHLVELDRIEPEFAAIIRQRGRKVYDRAQGICVAD
jgi:predicted nucleotidyltransferase